MAALIDTSEALASAMKTLRGVKDLAVDTESNSFHRYHERLCLLQLTAEVDGETLDFLIDPLAASIDMAPLVKIFADASVRKVFHDVGYDLVLIRRDLHVTPAPIFDTMLALRFLGHKRFGLASVLEERFHVKANKALQRADWSARPLSKAQLTYAAMDTHYLLPLTVQLEAELKEKGRWAWFQEECERLLKRPEAKGKSEEERFWSIKGLKKLKPEMMPTAYALFQLREARAKVQDRAVFRVMHNDTLLDIAEKQPKTQKELSQIPGVGPALVQAIGDKILQSVRDPGEFPLEKHKLKRARGTPSEERARDKRFEGLREKRRVAAEKLGVEPEVVLSNATLWELAEENDPEVAAHPDFKGWRADLAKEFG